MIIVNVISKEDNLGQLASEINAAQWDDANEMIDYDVDAMLAYVEHPDTVLLACHDFVGDDRILLGIASGRFQPKPYSAERWLYVDEVDVCADQRCRGAGKAMMKKFIDMAKRAGCGELWLGTESDNQAANALYRSLDPDDVTQVVGYTFEFEE